MVSLPLLVLLLVVLMDTVLEETRAMFWGTLSLLVIATVAAFLFSKRVFGTMNSLQEQNVYHVRELAALSEVHQVVNETRSLNALLNRAMDKLIQIAGADSGELYLIDEQSRNLVHTLHGGVLDDVIDRETQLQLAESLVSEASRSNEPIIMNNLNNVRNGRIASLADIGVRSLAVVPLNSRSGPIGVICLFGLNPDHFKLNDGNLLLNVGNQIAAAIENVQLYERVQATAVLEERERISAELHDGLAQVLGYVITKSQATRQLLRKMTVASDYLIELENVAQEVYTDTREAILGLKTASANRSMVSALREFSVRFNQLHGIRTEVEVGDRIIPSLSPQAELQAIRIVQEALSNVRKHAEATHATIKVAAGDDEVTVVVEDDGKGFDVDEAGKGDWTKLGLRNMKERAGSIHGRLSVESEPESGTRVTLSIPLIFSRAAIEEGEQIESTGS